LTFPTEDLPGGMTVISIEPDPDNSEMPFTMKVLEGFIPNGAIDHDNYSMHKRLSSFPYGTGIR